MWKLNKILWNSQWINEEIKEEIKKYLETNENGDIPKYMEYSKNNSKKEACSNTDPPQKSRKSSNK